MKAKFFISFICILVLSGCGYSLANVERNYRVTNINTEGDIKANFKLRNKILITSLKGSSNLIELNNEKKIDKSIKEKNIKNQINKYQIKITSSVNYKSLNKDKEGEFEIIKVGNYKVSKKYSQTLNSEKSIINSLINEIADEINENLSLSFNDS